MTDVIEQARALAAAATAPETFDFVAAVTDRDYPEVDVPIYLNEKAIRRLLDLQKQRDELLTRAAILTKRPEEDAAPNDLADDLELLDLEIDELTDSIKGDKFTMHIRGISPEKAIEIEDAALEAFPEEFEEVQHPLTGATVKTPIPNQDRNILQTALYRQAHIVSVTAANGAVDADFADVEKVKSLFLRLPALARVKVDEGIALATIATDFYRELADEVFSPRP